MNHEEKQALIQFNRAIITDYEACAVPEALWPEDVKKLVASARIALASLEAEPFGRIYIDDAGNWAVYAGMPAIRPCDDFHVYTALPAPEDCRHPVKLPDVEKWRSYDSVRAQHAYKSLVAKALTEAGHEVQE